MDPYLFLPLVFITFYGGVEAKCDAAGISNCLASFVQYQGITRAILGYYSETTLEEICNTFAEADRCLETALQDCSASIRGVWVGTDDFFTYLCSPQGILEYREHASCFNHTELGDAGKLCGATYDASIQATTNNKKGDPEGYKMAQCQARNELLKCFNNALISDCDSAATFWMIDLIKKPMQPTATVTRCILNNATMELQSIADPVATVGPLSTTAADPLSTTAAGSESFRVNGGLFVLHTLVSLYFKHW